MSSGRGIFLSAIVLIGILSIGSVLGISWLLQTEETHPNPPLSGREESKEIPTATPVAVTPLDKGESEATAEGGGFANAPQTP